MRGRGVGAQGIQTSRIEGGLKLVCPWRTWTPSGVIASNSPFLGFSMPVMGAYRNLPVCLPTLFGGWDPQLFWTAGLGGGRVF